MTKLMVVVIMVQISGCSIRPFAGAFDGSPEDIESMSPGAVKLLQRFYASMSGKRYIDCHVHLIGLPECDNGCYVNPQMRSIAHPIQFLKFNSFESAGGVLDENNADAQYLSRLSALTNGIGVNARYCILALDAFYDESGLRRPKLTQFYVPNDYVFSVTARHDEWEPVLSIHPYRKDAIAALRRWNAKGVRMIKWLPNAMGIDPLHDKSVEFCREMKKLGMVLLTHTGQEEAVESNKYQSLGNPLLLRRILDTGVTVIMAHCGSTGKSADLDKTSKKYTSNFELFARMMDDPKYKKNLFADVSAVTMFNRDQNDLKTLLNRSDWHPRLINGSDYPLPAINFLIRTGTLCRRGFITKEERGWLNEIYDCNPLIFDAVLKFTLRNPDTGAKFAHVVFQDPFNGRFDAN